jgi:CDP-diacylglycerol--serine O-phosphatidyltransferase
LAPAALAFAGKVKSIFIEGGVISRLTCDNKLVGMRTYLDSIALTYFVCCGIARLARYNATVALAPKDDKGKVHHFEGTPIPTSLSLVALIAYFVKNDMYLEDLPGQIIQLGGLDLHPLVLLYAVSGTLMISKTLRIPKP